MEPLSSSSWVGVRAYTPSSSRRPFLPSSSTTPLSLLRESSYLDSLGGGGLQQSFVSEEEEDSTATSLDDTCQNNNIPDEEYYGLTNPMANNWAGSKHETYGGYLYRLGKPPPPPQQQQKGPPRRLGGYLDSLQQDQETRTNPPNEEGDNGSFISPVR